MKRFFPLSVRHSLLILASVLALATGFASAEQSPDYFTKLGQIEERMKSRIGVAAIDVSTNRRVDYKSGERFIMCSTFKVLAAAAVLKLVDEKKEKLDRVVSYGERQLLEYAPVTRAHVKEGGMTLDALCAAAITQSDNTAANLLLETIGGPKGLTEFARNLGDKFTRLDRMEPELNMASPGDERDTTTPSAMANDLQKLLTSDVLSAESQARLEGWMLRNETGAKMIRSSVPADWKVGDKTGRSGNGASNDIAILRPPTGGPLFLAIYLNAPGKSSEERDALVAEIAKAAIDAVK